jgi:MFS family permease
MTTTISDEPIANNAQRLLWAGFTAILAAGVGFGVRGGIFGTWAAEFNFTGAQLGAIGGAGFTSFCFGIMVGGVLVDKIGYGKLVLAAFLFHVVSAVVTFLAMDGMTNAAAYQVLFWGMFLFGLANGTLEAVSNPLVATLFPKNRNHYLNILHASWPLGMVFGGVIGWVLGDKFDWGWKAQLSLYLIPTLIYGFMFFGQKFPKSEASAKGLKMGEMFKDVGILGGLVVSGMLYLFFKGLLTPFFEGPVVGTTLAALIAIGVLGVIAKITDFAIGHWMLCVLFIAHALVGAVELGTDGWIQNITGAILNPTEGKILFVLTSLMMFLLRFCAHFIETKLGLKPIGLLFVCALLGCLGLNLVSAISSFGPALGALLVYAIGKTFFWPTMLAVVGDRFPSTGAVAMSLMGGIGMMSAGLIGGPGLGYAKDRFAAEALQEKDAALFTEWKGEDSKSKFLGFQEVETLDPKRLEDAKKAVAAKKSAELAKADGKPVAEDVAALAATVTPAQETVVAADIDGNRKTLKVDSFIPAAMAVIYLLLMLYFRSIGGYRPLTIGEKS